MSLGRVLYRVRQFSLALRGTVKPAELAQALAIFTPAQRALFAGLHPSEQAHALSVYRQLVNKGETSPDLLGAALLHDIGKTCIPLRLWERIWIVLAKAVFPLQVKRGASLSMEAVGWRVWLRAFIVAEQHPVWGADLAAQAGASAVTVALIRQHQDSPSIVGDPESERLLRKLQAVDDQN